MISSRSESATRRSPVRIGEGVYFEMHKLDSEKRRLLSMRSLFLRRINAIDRRLYEIKQIIDELDRKSK